MTTEQRANAFQQLRELCGYVENGTCTKVSLCQDDATKYWYVTIGYEREPQVTYSDSSFIGVINKAHAALNQGE